MSSLYMKLLGISAACVFAVGCAKKGPQQQVPPDAFGNNDNRVISLTQHTSPDRSPLDAPAAMTLVFQVDIYQLSFPMGTYGSNDEFWKHIDEQCVDVATHDLLDKNGIRVGVAGISELKHFERFMAAVVPTQRFTVRATEVRNIEIEAKKDLTEQVIFHYDARNQSVGRSYDRCDNIINVSFEPAPRKPGALRLTLCPTVRAHRKHLEYSITNQEREFEYVSPERMYDLNLRADVPLDGFMIVAPSDRADWRFSVGNAFFVKEMPAQQMEQVLLIIPHAYRVPEDQVKSITSK